MKDYRDNLEIDIKDLFLHIIKSWKWLILALIFGCIIGFVYGGTKVNSNTVNIGSDNEINYEINKREEAEVNLAYKAIRECEELYEQMDAQGSNDNYYEKIELLKATQQLLGIDGKFSTAQKAYYASLFEGDNAISKDTKSENANQYENISKSNTVVRLKQSILGGFFALILAIVFLALRYILVPKLKTEYDLRNAFNLPVIGTIDSATNDSVSFVFSGIVACMKKAEANTVFLLSSSEDAILKEKRNLICDLFANKGVSVFSRGSILSDPSTIDEITSSDGVILFEKIGESRYENIAREIELCDNYGVRIIGTVVIV